MAGRVDPRQQEADRRQKYVEAWNKEMITIWQERIHKLKVIDTGDLWRSPLALRIHPDGRFYEFSLSQSFLEYGLWQDLGVGRELHHGDYEYNSKYIDKHGRNREIRRWMSPKYYSSVMNLRDFMAESLGDEFKAMFCAALDSDHLRRQSAHYSRKGYSTP